MLEIECYQCKKNFKKHKCYIKEKNFCSVECHNIFQRKCSLDKKINKICKICKKTFEVLKCYEHRYVTCGDEYCKLQNKQGNNNPNWRNSPKKRRDDSRKEYRNWRKEVLERDKYTCVECGTNTNLEVDHIKPYAYFPELRYDISNGRTLCKKCHHCLMKNVFIIRKELGIEKRYEIKKLSKNCIICNTIFYPKTWNNHVCSDICKKYKLKMRAREIRNTKTNERRL